MVRRTTLSVFLVLSLLLGSLFGQSPFSRYRSDQKREAVSVGQAVLPSPIDGKVRVTEREVVELALTHNFDINLQRSAVLGQRWRIDQLRGFYDPQMSFSLNWDREKTPAASVLQGGPSLTNILSTGTSGYAQTFPTGTSFEVNFSGVRNRTTSFFNSLVPAFNTQFEILFRQNLLEGFGKVGQEYQIQIARNDSETSRQEFKRLATDVILQVQDRYWELEYALRDADVKDKSLQLARTVLEQNRARHDVGTAARLEVVQAEAEVALRQEELVRSRYNYRLVQDQLIQLVSNFEDPRQFPGDLVPADPISRPDTFRASFEELKAQAFEARPEVEQARLDLANQAVSLNLTRNRLRPSLDLVAGYQQFGLGGTLIERDFSQGLFNPPVVGVIPGGVGDSLDQMFSADYYGYMLGLTLQVPIFNQEARAENAQAQISVDQAKLRGGRVRQQIAVQLREALTRLEMNRASLEAGEVAVRSAQERLIAEEARFGAGMATTREIIEAQRDLLLAETTRLRAQIDLIKSEALLDKATGRTFDRFGIQLVDALARNVK
ncbi:MAG: TolC family protein [Acidobacteria bacterium]|nr:MAG: TolC family protein [Acidobacteriota bacterium]